MTITEAMQSGEFNMRVSYGNRWLVSEGENQWIIYEQPYHKRVRVVDIVDNEDKAVSLLVAKN